VDEFGESGQATISKKRVVVIGCGGLGSYSSNIMVRTGIGSLDLVDDDPIEITNLHRTCIFNEEDIGKPKYQILKERLKKINSGVKIGGIKERVTKENIESIIENSDIILDGTDNMETRHLINEAAIKKGIPWVYAGVFSTMGMVMGIIPNKTPCIKCISPSNKKTSNTYTIESSPHNCLYTVYRGNQNTPREKTFWINYLRHMEAKPSHNEHKEKSSLQML
jgi:adenylyltransferase/sulfurtransferase